MPSNMSRSDHQSVNIGSYKTMKARLIKVADDEEERSHSATKEIPNKND